ncbi:hypothetical protein AN161_26395 [Lysinibacillus sp. FJAT-14222]|nr:hypothetical protein AN161_26395 [Lysinibacillus sp. FJAT-14222]
MLVPKAVPLFSSLQGLTCDAGVHVKTISQRNAQVRKKTDRVRPKSAVTFLQISSLIFGDEPQKIDKATL